MSQIFGHTLNTEQLSHKLGKSITNAIFVLPRISPCFMSTVRHPWSGAASFGTVRGKERPCN